MLFTESWADVVRESQDVVELAIKGPLRTAGVDPPRIHEVADVLEADRRRLPDGSGPPTSNGSLRPRAVSAATALHWAAHRDDAAMADALVVAGAAVDATNDLGVTPLWLACLNGNAALVETLLAAGADAALPSGETVLMTAARTGAADAVRLLVAHGADLNTQEGARGQTALMWAVAQGHGEVVRALVELGADVSVRSAPRPRRAHTRTERPERRGEDAAGAGGRCRWRQRGQQHRRAAPHHRAIDTVARRVGGRAGGQARVVYVKSCKTVMAEAVSVIG